MYYFSQARMTLMSSWNTCYVWYDVDAQTFCGQISGRSWETSAWYHFYVMMKIFCRFFKRIVEHKMPWASTFNSALMVFQVMKCSTFIDYQASYLNYFCNNHHACACRRHLRSSSGDRYLWIPSRLMCNNTIIFGTSLNNLARLH